MYVNFKWCFETVSDICDTITVAIGFSLNGEEPTLAHIIAGKHWDVARKLENLK